ncbi:hypothetical protein D1872_299960 [compost metagenome]
MFFQREYLSKPVERFGSLLLARQFLNPVDRIMHHLIHNALGQSANHFPLTLIQLRQFVEHALQRRLVNGGRLLLQGSDDRLNP